MKIGIIGSGTVATTLARGLAAHGHELMLGSRDPAKLDKVASEAPALRIGTMQQAAAFAELAILAVKGGAAQDALALAAAALAGKPVIDATNPIADAPPEHGVIRFFTGPNDSLGERLQAAHPQLRLVKAFNSVGAPFMIDPQFADGRPTMFIAGNDAAAKAAVTALLAEVGWDAADMGRIEASRAIEPLCQLWCLPGLLRNEWRHAFKLLQA
jgi:predicted dinucleotide-binding enzyme